MQRLRLSEALAGLALLACAAFGQQAVAQPPVHAESETAQPAVHAASDTAQQQTGKQTTQQPTAKQPTAQQSTAQQPTAQQPTARQPTTRQPTTQQSTAQQSTAQQPIAKQSALQPAAATPSASPIYGVTIPAGYRKWQLIAPAEEAAPLDELRVVLGNPEAMAAIERSAKRFPDGAVLVKLAYKRKPSPDFEPATIPGQPTTVQVMVKDSRRYASTGGWGFGRFVDGVAVDAAQHQTCFACHAARVKDRDYVFTRFAP